MIFSSLYAAYLILPGFGLRFCLGLGFRFGIGLVPGFVFRLILGFAIGRVFGLAKVKDWQKAAVVVSPQAQVRARGDVGAGRINVWQGQKLLVGCDQYPVRGKSPFISVIAGGDDNGLQSGMISLLLDHR